MRVELELDARWGGVSVLENGAESLPFVLK